MLSEISTLRLARLHNRAADAILATRGDGPDEAEPIAHHRLAAAAFTDPVLVAKAAVRASDVARWRNALETADRLAEHALGVLSGVPRTSEVTAVEVEALEAIVSSQYRRSGDTWSRPIADRIQDIAETTGSDAAMALWLFLTWGDVDNTDDLSTVAGPVEEAAVLAARTTDSYAIVTTRYMLASLAFLSGRFESADEHVQIALAAAGAKRPQDRPQHVPLVLLPVVAGLVAAMRNEPATCREHTHLRAPAWLSQRSEVDPTAEVALAFNRALPQALFGDPKAVLDELEGSARVDVGGFVRQQLATCDVLTGWARAKLGHRQGIDQALEAMARIDDSGERVLRSCLRTLIGDACLALDDRRAVELLERAKQEAVARGEVWWLAETMRLRAEADLRFGDGDRAGELLAEAEELAGTQGASLIVSRIAKSYEMHPHLSPTRTTR